MKSTRAGLSYGTVAKIDPLQKQLLEQFNNSYGDARTKRFLDDPTMAGTFADGQKEGQLRQTEEAPVQPVLSFNTDEVKGQAISLQKWEGIVIEVKGDVFFARLHDLSDDNPSEESEFSLDEVSEDDMQLLKPGAVFYWSIGYLTTSTGQRIRTSVVKFRRLPAWTVGDLKAAKQRANELRRIIGWGSEESEACAG